MIKQISPFTISVFLPGIAFWLQLRHIHFSFIITEDLYITNSFYTLPIPVPTVIIDHDSIILNHSTGKKRIITYNSQSLADTIRFLSSDIQLFDDLFVSE